MPNYRRVLVPGGMYFFTVTLLERRRTLLVDRIDVLREAFRTVHAARPFDTLAAVVLPDHLHCLWRLPAGDADYAARWRHIKTLFSQQLPCDEPRTTRRQRKAERGIWQRGYWDRLIRDDSDLQRHLDYIHFNPVKHGHAASAAEWPYSSFPRWVRAGVYPQDWGGRVSDPPLPSPHPVECDLKPLALIARAGHRDGGSETRPPGRGVSGFGK